MTFDVTFSHDQCVMASTGWESVARFPSSNYDINSVGVVQHTGRES
jgi:hypothetical protein